MPQDPRPTTPTPVFVVPDAPGVAMSAREIDLAIASGQLSPQAVAEAREAGVAARRSHATGQVTANANESWQRSLDMANQQLATLQNFRAPGPDVNGRTDTSWQGPMMAQQADFSGQARAFGLAIEANKSMERVESEVARREFYDLTQAGPITYQTLQGFLQHHDLQEDFSRNPDAAEPAQGVYIPTTFFNPPTQQESEAPATTPAAPRPAQRAVPRQ